MLHISWQGVSGVFVADVTMLKFVYSFLSCSFNFTQALWRSWIAFDCSSRAYVWLLIVWFWANLPLLCTLGELYFDHDRRQKGSGFIRREPELFLACSSACPGTQYGVPNLLNVIRHICHNNKEFDLLILSEFFYFKL